MDDVHIGPFVVPGERLYLSSAVMQRLKELVAHTDDTFFRILMALKTQKPISLRVLDWLVCNYAKKNAISVQVCSRVSKQAFNIHEEYKKTLKARRRRAFDPFQRKQRIFFRIGADVHTTTVAQVGFLVWALKNNVYAYACAHAQVIERDMHCTLSANRKRKKTKRLPLTQSKKDAFLYRGGDTKIVDDSEDDDATPTSA
jgi:hypothetical protein